MKLIIIKLRIKEIPLNKFLKRLTDYPKEQSNSVLRQHNLLYLSLLLKGEEHNQLYLLLLLQGEEQQEETEKEEGVEWMEEFAGTELWCEVVDVGPQMVLYPKNFYFFLFRNK